jgi:hypothetical protein
MSAIIDNATNLTGANTNTTDTNTKEVYLMCDPWLYIHDYDADSTQTQPYDILQSDDRTVIRGILNLDTAEFSVLEIVDDNHSYMPMFVGEKYPLRLGPFEHGWWPVADDTDRTDSIEHGREYEDMVIVLCPTEVYNRVLRATTIIRELHAVFNGANEDDIFYLSNQLTGYA